MLDIPLDWCEARHPIKALLIQPPTLGGICSHIPQVEEGEEGIGFKPPIGLLYIATTLAQYSDHEVKIIDCIALRVDVEEAVREAIAYKPDVVGISAWTDFWYPAYHLGKLIKEKLPDVHLVYGGPHIGIYPQETLNLPFVDSVIAGDGEIPFLYLCNLVANKIEDNRLSGLHFKTFGVKRGDEKYFIQKNIDALPLPDRTLLPIDLYGSVLSKSNKITTMITSRGCPHRCIFCKLNFQKCLCRSAESVVEEFRQIEGLGIREVEVYDDTFTWSKKRVIDICKGLIDKNIRIEWAVRDRVNKAEPDLLDLMYRAGCRRVHYGIESGVDRVLRRMRKGITTNQARFAVASAKSSKMTVLTYFMLGNIDETVEDIQKTIEFSLELDADYSTFSITIPYPGTAMYKEALASGIIEHDFWKSFARNPRKNFVLPQFIETNVKLGTLIGLRNEAIRRFYFRPTYLYRQIKTLRGLHEFKRKADMALQLIVLQLKALIKNWRVVGDYFRP